MDMKKSSRIMVLIAGLSMSPVWADGIVYKCKDQQGKMLYQSSPCARGDEALSSWAAQTSVPERLEAEESGKNLALVVRQQNNGHYLVGGAVNGKPLNFVVDTGASLVSLPRSFAYQANLSCREQAMMQTANGASSACTAVIARLKVGQFLFKDVSAMIVPNLSQALLGMNVLEQFRIEQDKGEMRLTPRQ